MKKYIIYILTMLTCFTPYICTDTYAYNVLQIPGRFVTDLYYTNGNDFFLVDEKLFQILWEYIDPIEGTADSIVMYSKAGENKWEKLKLPGKAYYLGENNNREICSIEKKKNIWRISFYSLDGKRLRSIDHKYSRQNRELSQSLPIPLVGSDGSIFFYTRYIYNLRNPISSFFLNLISGGHGSIPRVSDYIEIIPSLLKGEAAQKKEVTYAKIKGLSRITVFGLNANEIRKDHNYIVNEKTIGGYKIVEFFKEGTCQNFYKKDSFLISLGNNIEIMEDLHHTKVIAQKPTFIPTCSKLRGPGSEQSDIQIMRDNQIILVTSSAGVCIFDQKGKEWKRLKVPMARDYISELRIYKWDEVLYLGMWFLDKFEIIMCRINE